MSSWSSSGTWWLLGSRSIRRENNGNLPQSRRDALYGPWSVEEGWMAASASSKVYSQRCASGVVAAPDGPASPRGLVALHRAFWHRHGGVLHPVDLEVLDKDVA
jgi:hypothetical protein